MLVVVLEEPPCLAALTLLAHKGALAAIALPHGTPHVGRDRSRGQLAGTRNTRSGSSCELLFLELSDICLERKNEYFTDFRRR